jgi:Protein of unknown function (DUF1761)
VVDDVNVVAIIVAAVAVLVVSTVYYIALGKQLAQLSPAYSEADAAARPPGWKVAVELVRNLVLASVVACLAKSTDATGLADGVKLALLLWVGFPVVLWTGAVLWEKNPPKLAAIHAGDWLLKLLIVCALVSAWQ